MTAHAKNGASQAALPRKKKAFWIVTLLIPPLLLAGAELLLRWMEYGGDLDLVVKTRIMGKEWYTLNPRVAHRYFLQEGVAIPEPSDDLFEIEKQPNARRIFMLGESTMQGFPFDYNATAPRLLQDRLRQLLPRYHIEVINAGLSAVNSYTVLDFMNELLPYRPDAFVIYAGHNEFYGAMGVGSTEYLGRWRGPITLYMKLLKSKLFLLIRDGITALRDAVKHPPSHPEADLMEAMVRDKAIRYQSEEYKRALGNFVENLGEIASAASDHGVPVVFCTLTSNIRDQKPLMPVFSESTGDSLQRVWRDFEEAGHTSLRRGDSAAAAGSFLRAIAIDSTQAAAHFDLARSLGPGRTEEKEEFRKARDFDGLRFRAASEFNDSIRSLCRERHAILADVDAAFDANSPEGIVGYNLMLEHLHPNFDGYVLMSKCMLKALADNELLAPRAEWQWERDLSDEGYREVSGVTPFELEVARYKVFRLTNRWPFKEPLDPKETYGADTRVQQLAQQYVQKQIGWSDAHYALAEWYRANGDNMQAVREYYAVSKVLPTYYYPVMLTGDVYRAMKDDSLARQTYRRALSLQASPFVHARLGMLDFDEGKFGQCIEEFEAVIAPPPDGAEKVDTKASAIAYFYLGVSYGRTGNLEKARVNLQAALRLDPGNEDAKRILAQIP
jgi:Tfp pilus assembly protein PilF/lysophospholipase L1-like esterase